MKFRPRPFRSQGFTLMEILVVIAIIVVLASIAYPVYARIKINSNKAAANNILKNLATGTASYASANDGSLPQEDAPGKDSWELAKSPEAERAWYNAVPHAMGVKGVGDFAKESRTAAFYSSENVLFLPGAQYPENKRFEKPMHAIAMNSRLFRGDKDGKKADVKMANIQNPSRTVLYLETGLPGEPKAHDTQSKNDYDGGPKGTAKQFVARYSKRGLILFIGGHVEEVSAKQLLTSTGAIEWTSETVNDPSAILWMPDPKEDPNESAQ